ncbi:MAG: ATP-binding protein [Eubacterium sp.]
MFERFYRMDSSRNLETGGMGIELSVAKAIVLSHNGKITAISEDGKSLKIILKIKLYFKI